MRKLGVYVGARTVANISISLKRNWSLGSVSLLTGCVGQLICHFYLTLFCLGPCELQSRLNQFLAVIYFALSFCCTVCYHTRVP